MKKSNSIKILIAILFIFTLLSIYAKNEVKATEIEMENLPEPIPLKVVTREDLDRADTCQRTKSENIIIEYDHETGKTREINLENLEQLTLETSILGNKNSYKIEEYNPVLRNSGFPSYHKVGDLISLMPYKAICYSLATSSDGSQYSGSGFLVGTNLYLTAAHCIFDEDNNYELYNWITYAGATPSSNYGSSRLGENILSKGLFRKS